MEKQATDIFTSKKFWTMVTGLVMTVVVSIVPELEEHIDTLIPAILVIVGSLIGGYTIQDNAKEKYKNVS